MYEEELSLLGVENPVIIALGRQAFDILIDNLGGKYRIARARHYSYRISKERYREELGEILKRL